MAPWRTPDFPVVLTPNHSYSIPSDADGLAVMQLIHLLCLREYGYKFS